ncbi:hypothetical protein [Embleya scabrispora]|uniref:hypothetical protein n=1 Tax=Embleya scabrispora TaxID=159449 RepID=UPI00036AECFE|nr:hypothetical protein [Embleya scabrispora]MYS87758.1 hypothetical protein [Streptomyces sp. SID5474]
MTIAAGEEIHDADPPGFRHFGNPASANGRQSPTVTPYGRDSEHDIRAYTTETSSLS